MDLKIINASMEHLDQIMRVEQSWHEKGRAPREKLAARIKKYSDGFFLATIQEGGIDKVIATITSMPFTFDANNLDDFVSWERITNNGFLPDRLDVESCNALYIVSGIIDSDYRGHDIFSPMVLRVVDLAEKLGFDYVLAGAVIPGFRLYHEKNPGVSAFEYCQSRHGKSLVDPLLHMYERIGFVVTDEKYVIPEYFQDDDSMNYAALVVRDLRRKL